METKEMKGITLVALVVTIVVLLVLAGVSINLVLGDNGIITRAKEAREKSAEATENDLKGLNGIMDQIDAALEESIYPETVPYLPSDDFHYDESTSIDTGLVIQDSDGNEYVWVVVPRRKSIYLNGGFYVGRYEAGIETTGTNRTSNTDKNSDGKYTMPSTVPVSKADAYPYTYVTRTQAQNLASNVNSGTKTSSLMFGVQWDLVLAFMSKDTSKITSTDDLTKNSITIGNYMDSTFQLSQTGKYATMSNYNLRSTWNPSTTSTTNFVDSSRNKIAQSSTGNGILVTTGTSEKNKVMNIYDVAGNVWEWTLEKTSSTGMPCAGRGGDFSYPGSDSPAARRDVLATAYTNLSIGFRVSLF